MITHEGVRYSCSDCEYIATQSSHLKIHAKSHEIVKYPCPKCKYAVMDTEFILKVNMKEFLM